MNRAPFTLFVLLVISLLAQRAVSRPLPFAAAGPADQGIYARAPIDDKTLHRPPNQYRAASENHPYRYALNDKHEYTASPTPSNAGPVQWGVGADGRGNVGEHIVEKEWFRKTIEKTGPQKAYKTYSKADRTAWGDTINGALNVAPNINAACNGAKCSALTNAADGKAPPAIGGGNKLTPETEKMRITYQKASLPAGAEVIGELHHQLKKQGHTLNPSLKESYTKDLRTAGILGATDKLQFPASRPVTPSSRPATPPPP